MSSIADTQDKKEAEILQKYPDAQSSQSDDALRHSQTHAAKVLQRTYRGHRERRQLRGLSLDPTSRWTEAVKEAQYRNITTPRPPSSHTSQNGLNRTTSEARQNWSRIGNIARRAGADEESSASSPSDNDTSNPSQKEARRRKRLADKQERAKSAKMMDLSYFLEMVDTKHRYGSNLRKYHAEWKSRPTNQNLFYWLDHGDGKDVEVEKCSRERLENMQVRYLGREDRRYYEVIVDKEGKLCWRKDGVRVDTTDKWRDSIHGIVKVDDPTPVWAHRPAMLRGSSESSGMSSEEDTMTLASPTATLDEKKAEDTAVTSPTASEAPKRSLHNVFTWRGGEGKKEKKKQEKKKKQMWIFVADTKNNLYIGIKQTGAFQHSSFLHGSRVSAAGIVTVREGQLRLLQPRSGHYRTPSHNLHILLTSLRSRGVDMSVTAIGGTMAAGVGIETFMKTRGKIRGLREGIKTMTVGKKGKGEG
ncbi:hypothetical protein ACLMJK_006946 [Lecanora helva]